MRRLRQAAIARLTRWSARRHGRDTLPLRVHRRRIYIIPTRFGLALGGLLAAMLIAGLNYNCNLGLAFGFLVTSLVLVAMNHCHRNLLGLQVDAGGAVDAFAGATADFHFVLLNDAGVERSGIDIRCGSVAESTGVVPARGSVEVVVRLPVPSRGVVRIERFELRTTYPFGWFRAWTYVQAPLIAYVAPRPRGERRQQPSAEAPAAGWTDHGRGDEDYAGLRNYQAGMPLKLMAWKVLARGAEPAVRHYAGAAGQPEWLDWQSLDPLGEEARLSQLTRWVIDADRQQRLFGLRIPGEVVGVGRGPRHRTSCLRALAMHPAESPP